MLNNHWNNHLQFCTIIEAYFTLCYLMKWRDIGFLRDIIWEITIILQALSAKTLKYAREMLCQMHILDMTLANLVLKSAYIANALVNFWCLSSTFYKMDLLLKHQKKEFKQCWANQDLLLQETDKIFQLHALLVNILSKIRRLINRVILRRKRNRRYLIKNILFDI